MIWKKVNPQFHVIARSAATWQSVGGRPLIRIALEEAATSFLLHYIRGVMQVVTYSDLIQLGILIVSIISLVLQINPDKKEVTAHSSPANDYFC